MENIQRESVDARPVLPAIADTPTSSIAASPQRRTRRRFDIQLDVEITMGELHQHKTTMRMLSLGGAFIEAEFRPAFNTRVQLSFALPGRPLPVEVGGVVRWSDARGFGVQFDGLRAHAVWALGKFFDQQT